MGRIGGPGQQPLLSPKVTSHKTTKGTLSNGLHLTLTRHAVFIKQRVLDTKVAQGPLRFCYYYHPATKHKGEKNVRLLF